MLRDCISMQTFCLEEGGSVEFYAASSHLGRSRLAKIVSKKYLLVVSHNRVPNMAYNQN